jgi:hypothetical protein
MVTMEKPEIILIEDQMDPGSNALLLGVGTNPDPTHFCWGNVQMQTRECTNLG